MSRSQHFLAALDAFTVGEKAKREVEREVHGKAPAHELVRERWAPEKRFVFNHAMPAAMTVVVDPLLSITEWNPDGSVKRRLGHNCGFRAARFVRTSEWRPRASEAYNKHAAYQSKPEFRLWCETVADRDRLREAVIDLVRQRVEARALERDLNLDYYDLGFDVDLTLFAFECQSIASDLGIRTRDDIQLSLWVDRLLEAAEQLCAQLRHNRLNEKHVNAVLRRNAERGKS